VFHEDFKDIILNRAEKIRYYINRYHHHFLGQHESIYSLCNVHVTFANASTIGQQQRERSGHPCVGHLKDAGP